MSEVTRLLDAAAAGNGQAAADLLPLVYDELRKLATVRLAAEKPGQTLQATALVHEAYVRLVGSEPGQHWNGRGHFFAAAAEAMRRIMVDAARRKKAVKRGGGAAHRELADIPAPASDDEILDLDEALTLLTAVDPQKAELVKLRFFAGLTGDEAAQALGISPATADRYWVYARAWLRTAVRGKAGSPSDSSAADES